MTWWGGLQCQVTGHTLHFRPGHPLHFEARKRGMHKGAVALLWGEAAASTRASVFCWRGACFRRGGNPPAPAFPRGETEKGRLLSPKRAPLFCERSQYYFRYDVLVTAGYLC